eukprot:COSAG02_NODE_8721_length_2462_cov_6.146037_3_plen_148_part_00
MSLLQNLINGKELGHYGSVVSGEELDKVAEQKLVEHAAAAASSRALIAALKDRERAALVGMQREGHQQDAPQQKQGPRKPSKRARRKQQKAARATPLIGKKKNKRRDQSLQLGDTAQCETAAMKTSGVQRTTAAASSGRHTSTIASD